MQYQKGDLNYYFSFFFVGNDATNLPRLFQSWEGLHQIVLHKASHYLAKDIKCMKRAKKYQYQYQN